MRGRSPVPTWVIFGLGGVLLLLGVGTLSQFLGYKSAPEAVAAVRGGSEPNPAAGTAVGPPAAKPGPPPRDASAEELAVALSRVEAALGQCDRCRAKLDRLAGLVAGWGTLTKDIETNDPGRRLAASEVGVRTYLEVANPADGFATDGLVGRLRERLRLLEAVPEAAKGGRERGYLASDAWAADLSRLEGDAVREAVKLEQASGLLVSLLDANSKAAAGAPTLAAALAALKKKLFDEKLAVIAIKEAEAIKAGNELVAEARKVAVETEKRLEAKRSLDEAVTKEEKAKTEKLRAKTKTDEVKKYLGHLFVESYYQPTRLDDTNLFLTRTDKKLPMSLKAISGLGGMDAGMAGLRKLSLLFGSYRLSGADNYERPRLKMTSDSNHWTNDHHEFLQKARELLKELGPVLVEEGLLSP